jgi:hypothetical protein
MLLANSANRRELHLLFPFWFTLSGLCEGFTPSGGREGNSPRWLTLLLNSVQMVGHKKSRQTD